MKFLKINSASCLLVGSLFLAPLNAIAEEPLDFTRINATIEQTLANRLPKSDAITKFNYAFDADKTDLSKDQLQIKLVMELAKSPWSEEALKIESDLGFSADLEEKDDKGFSLAVNSTYYTDALVMIKHVVPMLSKCDKKLELAGVKRVLRQRHCQYIAKLKEISSIEDLKAMLKQKIADHKADLEDYSNDLNESESKLSTTTNTQLKLLIQEQLDKAKSVIEFLEQVKISGEMDELILESPEIKKCPILDSTGLNFQASERELNLRGTIHLKFGKFLYTSSKGMIKEILRGLENGEEFAIKFVELDAEVLQNLIASQLATGEEE